MNSQFDLGNLSTKEQIKRMCNGILAEIAPEEMILTDQIVEAFMESHPDSTDEADFASEYIDTPLGFGGDGELYAAIIVPIITGALSKMLTAFSDEKLKQEVNIIQSGKPKKGLEVETKVDEIKKEITIRLSSKSLTRKKAAIITNRILRVIADELSK